MFSKSFQLKCGTKVQITLHKVGTAVPTYTRPIFAVTVSDRGGGGIVIPEGTARQLIGELYNSYLSAKGLIIPEVTLKVWPNTLLEFQKILDEIIKEEGLK